MTVSLCCARLFLDFPNSFYATLAKARIEELENLNADEKTNNQEQKIASLPTTKEANPNAFTPTSSTKKCDQLAAHNLDKNKRAKGVFFSELETTAAAAVTACERAIAEFPNDPSLQYQLGRSLVASKDYNAAKKMASKGGQPEIFRSYCYNWIYVFNRTRFSHKS